MPLLRRLLSFYLNVVFKLKAPKLEDTQLFNWLLTKLQRFPYWIVGHRFLGWRALQRGDYLLAYNSAQVMQAQIATSQQRLEGQWLAGECFLRQGEFERAEELLKEVVAAMPHNHEAQESLAATYGGLGRFAEAVKSLERIPEEHRRIEARAALLHYSSKLT